MDPSPPTPTITPPPSIHQQQTSPPPPPPPPTVVSPEPRIPEIPKEEKQEQEESVKLSISIDGDVNRDRGGCLGDPHHDHRRGTRSNELPRDASEIQTQSKIAALEAKIAGLRAELLTNQAREEEIRGTLKTSSPETTVQNHISLLHEYNQIRDIGTGLMGIIAENRGVRVRDVYQEFGVGEGD